MKFKNIYYILCSLSFFRQIVKKDKGAAMTLVYKELSQEHALVKSDKSVFLAGDAKTKKVLVLKKFKTKSNEDTIALPTVCIILDCVLVFNNLHS